MHFLINCIGSKTVPLDDYEMKETYEPPSEMITSQHVPCVAETHEQPFFFGNLTSFAQNQQQQQPQQQQHQHQNHQKQQQQPQWPLSEVDDVDGGDARAINGAQIDWLDEITMNNGFEINDVLIVPPLKPCIDQNNNEDFSATDKQYPSFFQMAKKIYGNLRNLSIVNFERTLDEITKQMALLRFTPG